MSNPLSAMLDELMGKHRNAMPDEEKKETTWQDPEVCPFYLCGYCPHEMFTNTKADLGPCYRIHDEKLKEQYVNSPRFENAGLEDEFLSFLQRIQSDMQRKIDRNKQRLELTQPGGQVGEADKDKIVEKICHLTEKINALLSQAEQLGEKGQVEEAQGVVKMMEELKEERDRLQITLSAEENDLRTMEVCDICGCFLVVNDAQHRLDEHYLGKQHLGFAKIKATVDELLRRRQERRDKREKELKALRDKEDEERRNRRDKDRSSSTRRRSRSPRDSRKSHSRKSRSRSRDRKKNGHHDDSRRHSGSSSGRKRSTSRDRRRSKDRQHSHHKDDKEKDKKSSRSDRDDHKSHHHHHHSSSSSSSRRDFSRKDDKDRDGRRKKDEKSSRDKRKNDDDDKDSSRKRKRDNEQKDEKGHVKEPEGGESGTESLDNRTAETSLAETGQPQTAESHFETNEKTDNSDLACTPSNSGTNTDDLQVNGCSNGQSITVTEPASDVKSQGNSED